MKKLILLAAITLASVNAFAQGTAFTCQGRLADNGTAATGNYDLQFTIYDAASGGNQAGNSITNSPVAVSGGTFTTLLDFGTGVFPGANRWLQIGVRTNGSAGAFTPLNPRQALTASPYAITASDVTSANISRLNVPNTATQATGTPTVSFGFVVNAAVTSGGSGYGTPPTVTVNDATGSGAVIAASISGGAVTGLAVQANGSGYSTNATLTIALPPSNAFQTFVSPNFFTGVSTMNNVNNTFAGSFTGNGGGLTLDASQLASGTVADARLSANVPLLNGSPAFAGTVTAASFNGSGALPWQVVSGTAQQAQPNTGYLLTNDALVTVTLPTAPNPGDVVRLSGSGAGGWSIAQNVSQSVLARNIPGNFGGIWTPRESNRNWVSTASSSDGSKLVAVVLGGQIYTSTDSGVTWTPRDSVRNWYAAAASSDGSKLVAVIIGAGQIYTSTNSGVTWTPRESNRSWFGVASSSDGSKLVAVDALNATGLIYTSTDSGVTWTPRESVRNWWPVASSSDGSKLVAAVNGGQIYTSTNSGVTWTPRESNRNWVSAASSSDGSKLVVAVNGGQIYTSTDSGVTWASRESNRIWRSVASSSDGSKLIATVNGGQIYTSSSTSASGTAGYLLGDPNSAVELQYIGNGQFVPLSHEGTIIAY
jgi:photosystem II stability/assembly factor-like uncharacterized protein